MNAPARIRVLLVDDHLLVRAGLADWLRKAPDVRLEGEAGSGAEAVELHRRLRPDVVIMDRRLPDIPGTEATRRILAEDPAARVLILSIDETGEDVHAALAAGAWGYLAKSVDRPGLLEAVRALAAGRRHLPPELRARLEERNARTALSARETEVLEHIARGLANKEIAEALRLSQFTVKVHVANILAKLGVPDRTRAVTLALERGIVRMG